MSSFEKFKQFIASIIPGLFIVGYVIGTGSVTSMVVSGARYGMSFTWALFLSCFFTFILLIAISRLTIITGHTIMFNIKNHIGWFAAVFIIAGLMVTVISSIMGVMAIVAEVIQEWSRPLTEDQSGFSPLFISIVFLSFLLLLYWTGKHGLFIRFVSLMVGVMGIAFVLTNFMIVHDPAEIFRGIIPGIPSTGKPHLIIAGMVGTTMAAVVLVSRSSVVAEKGWKPDELNIERRDAIISVTVLFLISAAIMASAAGTLYTKGIYVDNAIEMVSTLEPLAGRFAIAVFVTGIIAAGLSSIFPNMLLLPWLISDYRGISRNLTTKIFRVLVVLVTLSGLFIPVFGGSPIVIMIASQAFSPLMMPLLIIFLLIMLNSKKLMGDHKIGFWLNAGLITTVVFSLFMFFIAFEGYLDFFG
ncbi:MAG: divalent metal cation transporter [Cyclobacteriaceae bacterium]|nr:divalent metal cation transporter [Cyclobacteriaceae bacterium]